MVSVQFISTLVLSASTALGFQLLKDNAGNTILPPTNFVLSHLKDKTMPNPDCNYYDVLTTVHSNGEIVHVNLDTHEIKQTGKFKFNYDNSAYENSQDLDGLFKRAILRDDNYCFNQDFELETSQCGYDFIEYANAQDCGNDAKKYSCVLDVMKQQDATLKLKDMDDVPAQVRCYKKISDAKGDKPLNGACAK